MGDSFPNKKTIALVLLIVILVTITYFPIGDLIGAQGLIVYWLVIMVLFLFALYLLNK